MDQKDYSKVREDSKIFEKKRRYAEYGLEFICPNCGCEKYLLGQEAKEYLDKTMDEYDVRCGNCQKRKLRFQGKLSPRRSVHLNNIKSRNTEISDRSGAVNR